MNKPDTQLFLGCPAEVRRYIADLEQQVKTADERTVAAIQHQQALHQQLKQSSLDQFAMAALPSLVSQRHLSCFECAAAAYNYAKAMQAELQKQQGGEV